MSPGRGLFLDWCSTTPLAPEALKAMVAAAETAWGNPQSVHSAGRRARAAVEDAREAVGALAGRDPRDVVLTSGGTEANNLALERAMRAGAAIVASRLEHPSIVRPLERYASQGGEVLWVPVPRTGAIELEAVEASCRAVTHGRATLLCLQAVNHETGVVQPVAEVARWAERSGIELHVDAVQAAGKLPPEQWQHGTTLSLAGHKLRGPKGIGALVTVPRTKLSPVLLGGEQERGLRPGTQDPVACAGLAAAAARAEGTPARYAAVAVFRDALEERLIRLAEAHGGLAVVNGDPAIRAPHVSNLSWDRWEGPELCAALDLEGVCVSSGSACSAGTADPSPVILAVAGVDRARSAVRVSVGEDFDKSQLESVLRLWERVLTRRRAAG